MMNTDFWKRYYGEFKRIAICIWIVLAIAATTSHALEFREIRNKSLVPTGVAIPREAVQVFVYTGEPRSVSIAGEYIAVDYEQCGVLFDRKTGERARSFTVADGWPENRFDKFPPRRSPRAQARLLGPGVLKVWRPPSRPPPMLPGGPFSMTPRRRNEQPSPQFDEAVSAEFNGQIWRAFQPADFLRHVQTEGYKDRKGPYASWTGILTRLNERSYLEASVQGDDKPTRYTMSDGLASNIVTKLVAADGTLWAVCADIYDPEKGQWGPGGLCRFDPKNSRWKRIERIDGRPVRWVTL